MFIIICEHLLILELWRSFKFLVCCGNLASVPKATVINYFRISYFEHASPKLNLVLISRAIQNVKDLRISSLWTC